MNFAEYQSLLRAGRARVDAVDAALTRDAEELAVRAGLLSEEYQKTLEGYHEQADFLHTQSSEESLDTSVDNGVHSRTWHAIRQDADDDNPALDLNAPAFAAAVDQVAAVSSARHRLHNAKEWARQQDASQIAAHERLVSERTALQENLQNARGVRRHNRRWFVGDVVTGVAGAFMLLVYGTLALDGMPFGNAFFLILTMAAIYAGGVLLLPSFVYPHVTGGSKGGLWALGVLMSLGFLVSGLGSLLGAKHLSVPGALVVTLLGGGVLALFGVRLRRAVQAWRTVKRDVASMEEALLRLDSTIASQPRRVLAEFTEREALRLRE